MKTTITESDFIRDFERIRPKHFSHDGLKALFAYLGEFEEQTGDEIEFDVIGLCCDFAEYNTSIITSTNSMPITTRNTMAPWK